MESTSENVTINDTPIQLEEEFDKNDINKEKFQYIIFGSGLVENILGT